MMFYALSIAAYCVSLRGSVAELEGELSMTPYQVVENLEAQQGAD